MPGGRLVRSVPLDVKPRLVIVFGALEPVSRCAAPVSVIKVASCASLAGLVIAALMARATAPDADGLTEGRPPLAARTPAPAPLARPHSTATWNLCNCLQLKREFHPAYVPSLHDRRGYRFMAGELLRWIRSISSDGSREARAKGRAVAGCGSPPARSRARRQCGMCQRTERLFRWSVALTLPVFH
ncbi:unnamed protein product [Euphydryas editha]|uniref:Uncharacterized protein n=1 Tax=Euphydryas editha TaxID=104508 RepID=A0AAU9TXT7_EUPED|nr:unnamed protein product [Euphydryas editha]